MLDASYAKRHAIAVIHSNHAAVKIGFECVEYVDITLMLNYGKFRKHLIPYRHFRMRIDAYIEATFPIDESDDPLSLKFHRSGLNVKSLRILPCRA